MKNNVNMSVLAGVFLMAFSGVASSQSFGSRLCANDSRYSCYTVKSGETWQKLFPNADRRDLVKRINRINIHLYPGMRIAVPKNTHSTDMLDYAPLSRQISPPGEKIILVSINPNQLVFGAYSAQGTLEYWGPVSGGRGYCPDIGRGCRTATGTYAIYNKGGAGCKSTKYPVGRGGAPMPYCMFFHGGFAMHGSYDVPGYNASHGCLRMFINDAQWLNQNFTRGEGRVPVIIRSNQI